MKIGEEAQTVTEAVYSDGTRYVVAGGIVFHSSNEAVATVNESGLVKAVGEGMTVISAVYGDFTDTVI